jgi:hypothetical protein
MNSFFLGMAAYCFWEWVLNRYGGHLKEFTMDYRIMLSHLFFLSGRGMS